MKTLFTIVFLFSVFYTNAQIGIGTTSPNSTLDVRGSFSLSYRSFTTSTTASSTDNILAFTGTSAATLTLPDATTCTGRSYSVKNASTTVPTPLLTIATSSSQTIDGNTSWLLETAKKIITVVSDGSNWIIGSSLGMVGSQPYASVSSSTNQYVTSTTSSKLITYETNETINLITHSTTVNPSRITIQVSGTYLITFSAELSSASGIDAEVSIWLQKNGVDVARSTSKDQLASNNGLDYRILSSTFIVNAIANDYFELLQSSTDVTSGLVAFAAGTSPTRPGIPSVIVRMHKISD